MSVIVTYYSVKFTCKNAIKIYIYVTYLDSY